MGEVEMVPIIGVEPTTFDSNDVFHKSLILRTECAHSTIYTYKNTIQTPVNFSGVKDEIQAWSLQTKPISHL
ncbi:hypothetical protein CWN02_09150 [Klebsiella pneumoniae]|nr:hypothetical protein CWN02_09150 [Klebsiella pneumoniae]